jgi:glucose-1-phosphate adenylyltransferase
VRDVVTLVLSGGGGEKLSVMSSERAVSAIPFGGKYRIIDFVLSNCCHSGIEQIGVLTQHAPTSLHDHIGSGRPWDLDRRAGGVMILQPYQTRGRAAWYRGTADAIAQNWSWIESLGGRRLLVLSGDHICRMDYRRLIETHERDIADITLAVTPVAVSESRRFGMVTTDAGRRVRGLAEKPERSDTTLASMGVYVIELAVLRECMRDEPVDLVADVIMPLLRSNARVMAHAFEGYWEDVGTVLSYYRANFDLLPSSSRFSLDDRAWPILTRDEERPPVLAQDGARIEDSLVSNGCRISGTVVRSVLSPGVVVGAGAVVEDSIVLQDAVIERGANVKRAILDKYTHIGADARIGAEAAAGRGEGPDWLEGLVLIGKDARLPEGTRVEPGVVIGLAAGPADLAGGLLRSGAHVPDHTWYEEGA